MNQKIPDYLNEKGNIVRLVIYTAAFALVFINIYQPFGSQNWFQVSDVKYFLFSSLIILTGVLVVVISRIIMFYYSRNHDLFVLQYALWVLVEITAMSLFYTLLETFAFDDTRSFKEMMKQSTINTSLVLLLPYSTIWLYFSLKDKNKKLQELSQELEILEQPAKGILNFFDEKKELRLSVSSEQVLWIEAADNYVKIHYLNKGKVSAFLIRNTLKVIEEGLANTSMVRCNRSTIVNFDHVKILRKEKEGIFLGLDKDYIPDIPVSKTYADRVMLRFSNYLQATV
jgi:DNA-binding LytR/AlgR family response regulator